VSALFWLVVRWIAATLIGVALGSAAAVLGFGVLTVLGGAVALLIGGMFVAASVLASNLSVLSKHDPSAGTDRDPVAGPYRATLLGFLGAGVLAGSVNGTQSTAIVAGVTGAVAIALSLGAGPAEQRRFW
jgi:hypothetical protein